MPQFVWNEQTGERFYLESDGSLTPAPTTGALEAFTSEAGAQVGSYGRGIQALFSGAERDDELRAIEAQQDAERRLIREEYPIATALGAAAPGMASMFFPQGRTLAGGLAANAAYGAAEGLINLGANDSSQIDDAVVGGIFGAGGDLAGRLIGRVFNGVKGLVNDIKAPRGAPDNPLAAQAEELGIPTLGSQRLAPGSQEQVAMSALERGAESSILPPTIFKEVAEGRAATFTDAALDAVGISPGQFDTLGADALRQATDNLSDEFGDIARLSSESAPLNIGEQLGKRLAKTGQIRELIGRGEFPGLEKGILSGSEYNVARRALAQDAAKKAAKGDYEIADRLFKDVEVLDDLIKDSLPPDTLARFARAREQYRNLRILNKSGVINSDDTVSIRNLNRALRQDTGYGALAREGRPAVNPETDRLIEVARVGADPTLVPFRSSGTAERQALTQFAPMLLDPTQWVGAAGALAAPAAIGAASRGGGRAIGGLATPAPGAIVRGTAASSREFGRSLLDEQLYPFVGSNDDRRQQ